MAINRRSKTWFNVNNSPFRSTICRRQRNVCKTHHVHDSWCPTMDSRACRISGIPRVMRNHHPRLYFQDRSGCPGPARTWNVSVSGITINHLYFHLYFHGVYHSYLWCGDGSYLPTERLFIQRPCDGHPNHLSVATFLRQLNANSNGGPSCTKKKRVVFP
jgi:hypothetical protein